MKVPFVHSSTSCKLKAFSTRFELTALLPFLQNPLACSLKLQSATCTHTCMLLQGPSEAFKHTGGNKSTEGQGNTASHDSSSCTSWCSPPHSKSSESSELDSTLAGQLVDGVAEAPGSSDASRNTAKDSIKASGSALDTAEQTAILADLHLFSRYTILLTCPLCIFLLITGGTLLSKHTRQMYALHNSGTSKGYVITHLQKSHVDILSGLVGPSICTWVQT